METAVGRGRGLFRSHLLLKLLPPYSLKKLAPLLNAFYPLSFSFCTLLCSHGFDQYGWLPKQYPERRQWPGNCQFSVNLVNTTVFLQMHLEPNIFIRTALQVRVFSKSLPSPIDVREVYIGYCRYYRHRVSDWNSPSILTHQDVHIRNLDFSFSCIWI